MMMEQVYNFETEESLKNRKTFKDKAKKVFPRCSFDEDLNDDFMDSTDDVIDSYNDVMNSNYDDMSSFDDVIDVNDDVMNSFDDGMNTNTDIIKSSDDVNNLCNKIYEDTNATLASRYQNKTAPTNLPKINQKINSTPQLLQNSKSLNNQLKTQTIPPHPFQNNPNSLQFQGVKVPLINPPTRKGDTKAVTDPGTAWNTTRRFSKPFGFSLKCKKSEEKRKTLVASGERKKFASEKGNRPKSEESESDRDDSVDLINSDFLSSEFKVTKRSSSPAVLDLNQGSDGLAREGGERVNYYPNCDPTVWIRSCTHPVNEPIEGVKSGTIPQWIKGSLIRNGPGRMQVGNDSYNHIFDGSALLHKFTFKDGNVTYKNKFLQSSSYQMDSEAQRIVVNYFGTKKHPDPCKTILQNLASKFSFEEHFTDNAQISVYPYGDALYALTETPFVFRVDPDTLDTKEKINMTKYLAILNHTAHPHVERNGTVYNIGQGIGLTGPMYHICEFPDGNSLKSPFEKARVLCSIKSQWLLHPSYMHSFCITPKYFVIVEQPLVVSTAKVLKGMLNQEPMIEALQWWEKETKLHVIDRASGKEHHISYVTETFFFLHTINAYEENNHLVIDIAAYRDAKMLDCMYMEALKNAAYDPSYARKFRGRPKRWVLPLKPRQDFQSDENLITLPGTSCQATWVDKNTVYVQSELLANIGCEVPRINYENYNGKKYQYFYAICSDVDHPIPGTLVKVDVVNKRHLEWGEDNVYPSEPVFIPSPNAEREDDGVLLSSLLRCKGLENQVCLLVLDASTFRELGRVEFVCEGPVPKCLHGWFVPQGALRGQEICDHGNETESETEYVDSD